MGCPLSRGREFLFSMGGFGWRCHLETGAAGGDFFFGWVDRTPARILPEIGFEWGSFWLVVNCPAR